MMDVRLKRVYEAPTPMDGTRVLVDRLWPRGLKKDQARINLWLKELAPSTELRKWFGHDPDRWDEFRRRYFEELAAHSQDLAELRAALRRGRVTLLYSARDERRNNAVALREFLRT